MALVPESCERFEETHVVARMQTDRRFVEHVEDPAQVRAKLRGQPNALRFAATQRFCRTPEREITKSDLFHETQSLLDLGNKTGCDRLVRVFEFQAVDRARCFARGKIRELINRVTVHTHVTPHGVQTRAVTTRAFARLAFLDPLRLAFRCKLAFQNRFPVTVRGRLEILVPNFAEPTTL